MSKPWLASYPPGVPAEIDSHRYRSLAHLAEESFAAFAARTAYVQMDKSLSFGELDRQSRAFAAWLQHRAGIQRGDRVAIMMPNVLQYPIALFGVLRAGGTVVNTNPLYTATPMGRVRRRSDRDPRELRPRARGSHRSDERAKGGGYQRRRTARFSQRHDRRFRGTPRP
jgi:acyl-CoA synthetase (AMP-forming)/AMP-acid ligase II